MRVLVLQWARAGMAGDLRAVEDELTPIARRHGAVRRERASTLPGFEDRGGDPPDEVHTLDFPDREAFDAFLDDPDRPHWSARLGEVLGRTSIWVLDDL